MDANFIAKKGYQTAFTLRPNCISSFRYLFGTVPIPDGFGKVADCAMDGDSLAFKDENGLSCSVRVSTSFVLP